MTPERIGSASFRFLLREILPWFWFPILHITRDVSCWNWSTFRFILSIHLSNCHWKDNSAGTESQNTAVYQSSFHSFILVSPIFCCFILFIAVWLITNLAFVRSKGSLYKLKLKHSFHSRTMNKPSWFDSHSSREGCYSVYRQQLYLYLLFNRYKWYEIVKTILFQITVISPERQASICLWSAMPSTIALGARVKTEINRIKLGRKTL